jgi:hypothetical protein
MRHVRRHPTGIGANRRRTTWARSTGTLSNASAATWDTIDLLAGFRTSGGTTAGCTIARIHLRLAMVTGVAADDQLALGVLRGQNTDVGVTVAGAPTPSADPYEDWMYWSVFTASSAPICMFPGGGNVYEVDIRSKRKIPELQQTLTIVANTPAAGAFPQQCVFSASILLMLP